MSTDTKSGLSLSYIRSMIDKADAAYYTLGSHMPIMTDMEYDILKGELRKLDSEDIRLSRVGYPEEWAQGLRTKVVHNFPMGSLDNTDDGIDGVQPFLDKNDLLNEPMVLSHKVDGSSITASYVGGKLVRVTTRGNGIEGTVVTNNGVLFKNLPSTIDVTASLDVRGEAILFKKDFQKIAENDPDASNPRNVGNGIIGREDCTDSDKINFIAFDVKSADPVKGSTVNQLSMFNKFKLLSSCGFNVVSHKLLKGIGDITKYYESILQSRDELEYEIDGIVIMPDSYNTRMRIQGDEEDRLRPKYARAIKFPHMFGITTVESVLITVGHTGAIIPTAQVSKVKVGGVHVSNVLLNNWNEIERLNVNIGDKVKVVLTGDIIPKITEVVEKNSDGFYPEPTTCICSSKCPTFRVTRNGEKGAVTYCSGAFESKCDIASVERIKHWIGGSKKGIGILGIGDSIVDQLVQDGMLKSAADLYRLTIDGLAAVKIGGKIAVGKSRAKTIIDNIQAKSVVKLHEFLGCVGVDFLGRRRAQILIKDANGRLDTIDQWLDTKNLGDVLAEIAGPVMSVDITSSMLNNMPYIMEMLEVVSIGNEPKVVEAIEPSADKKFAGLSFCFTGTRECIEEVEKLGGEIKSGISKNLSILVQGDPMSVSSKTQKAEQYGTRIISLEFLKRALAGEVDLREELAL